MSIQLSKGLRLSPTSEDKFARARELHLAKLRHTMQHTADPNVYVCGVSANLLVGADAYNAGQILTLHHLTRRQGNRVVGAAYGQESTYILKFSHYPLPAEAFTVFEGIRVLSPAALIIDHLRNNDPYAAIANAEAVIRRFIQPNPAQRSATEYRFTNLLRKIQAILSTCHFRGVSRIEQRLPYLSPWSESIGESVAKVGMILAGLPLPTQQVQVRINGFLYRIDYVWEDLQIAAEFDGFSKYSNADTLTKEKMREDSLRLLYPRFIRIVWHQALSPEEMLKLRDYFPKNLLRRPRKNL